MSKNVKHLLDQFVPKKYLLNIDVDRDNMTFTGSVIISGKKTGRPNQRLTFHQSDLEITSVNVVKHDKTGDHEVEIDRINHHNKFDEVRLHATHMLYNGSYTVRLEFKGKITRQMNGVYPCFFTEDGEEKKLIATQFESHHAREVFPCIDEPAAKATFELTLTSPAGETALSNTPVKKSKEKDGRVTTTFEPTPHMSTYLLAFIFGELGYKEAKTKDGIVVRTYATPENVEFTKYALEIAVKCLEFYEDYFGIKYPLEKCDFIALPDFASGAMENWGCITFREQAMLVDPKNSTLATQQYVALVVAHELTHQWFGNLVTMRWWSDLWLNEGFASWMEYLAIDHLYPDWQLWTQFAVDEQQQALKLDALEHTHPIEVPIHHPDEIRTIFDAISYNKGASVIHMLHEYLGHDAFRDGLRHYLATHKYANTDTVDLWSSLEEVSGKPVREFMNAWTSLPGYPVVSATVTDQSVKLKQTRFFTNPSHGKVEPNHWPIPLLTETNAPDTFDMASLTFKPEDYHSFKLNRGQSGFYRTVYNATHFERLGNLIKKGRLEPLDRLGILIDIFEAAKAGYADTVDALHFLDNFAHEDNFAAWDAITGSLGSLRMVMNDEDLREDMKPYIRKLVAPQLKRLGWERRKNDTHFDKLMRPVIFGLAASADEEEVVARCKELFASIDTVHIDPDFRGTVFGTIARLGGEAEFDKLVSLHNKSTLSEERVTLAAAITGFQQPELIKRALDLIDTDDVRLQDVTFWMAYSFMNRHGKHLTWKWMKTHWEWLQNNLGSDLSFYRVPIYSARVFSEKSFIKEYQAFFEPKMSPALERSYNQGLEMLGWQTAWRERGLEQTKAFFKAKTKK